MFKELKCRTGNAKIYIAGCPIKARQICQQWVEKGACVNVVDTEYIYKYGCEKGVVVEFINYPRFPKGIEAMIKDAEALGRSLAIGLSAGSYSIAFAWGIGKGSQTTKFYSRRGDIE